VDSKIDIEFVEEFQSRILSWYKENGRVFPWRYTFNSYKVMVSEVLLQQTNADKVVQPYLSITERYQSVYELLHADYSYLLSIFREIGLLYRADRLIDISAQVITAHSGKIPEKREELISIKGIGNYSCNAILCFGYNKPYCIVDTNVIRIFEKVFGVKSDSKRPHTDKKIWEFAQEILTTNDFVDYNYGLLDFAALVCKKRKPVCDLCSISSICRHYGQLKLD
jgi:A/G-specific adenine glycosylase